MPAMLIWVASIGRSCQTENMAALLNSLFFMFKMLRLPKYRVIYYDYIHSCKVVQWDVNSNVMDVDTDHTLPANPNYFGSDSRKSFHFVNNRNVIGVHRWTFPKCFGSYENLKTNTRIRFRCRKTK